MDESSVNGGVGPRESEVVIERPTRFHFAGFRYDAATGELAGPDGPVDLAPTPAALLELLLASAGEVVTRATAWEAIWPDELFDLDQKLNYAVHQLRRALGDDASEPRFVQTLPRRGYRWVADIGVAEVGVMEAPAGLGDRAAVPDVGGSERPIPGASEGTWRAFAVAAALVIALGAISMALNRTEGGAVYVAPDAAETGDGATTRPGAEAIVSSRGESDPAAVEAYRIGRHLLDRSEEGDLALAESYFWAALDADESFAPAWVGLATVHEEEGDRRIAAVLLGRALSYDPGHPRAHSTLGRYALDERRWVDAKKHLMAAAASDPTDSGVYHQLAHRAAMLGDFDEAIEHIEEAMRLNPGAAVAQGDAGWIFYWAGHPRRAVEECSRHQTIGGENALARACLLSAYLSMEDVVEAARIAKWEMDEAGVEGPTSKEPGDVLQYFFRWRLEELERLGASQYARARVAAMMGDHQAALDYLEASTGTDEPSARYTLAEPIFRALHETPAFERVRSRLVRPVSSFASR